MNTVRNMTSKYLIMENLKKKKTKKCKNKINVKIYKN